LGEASLKTYVGGLAALAIALVAAWAYQDGVETDGRLIVGALVFCGLLYLASIYRVRVSERCEVSALDIGLMASVAMLGPFWTAVAALPCAVAVGKRDWLRTAYEASRNTVQLYLAGIVFSAAAGPLMGRELSWNTAIVYATLASGTTLLVVGHTIHASLLKVKYRQGFGETWKKDLEPYLLSDGLSVLTAGLGVAALLVYGSIAALVVVAGSTGCQVLVYRSREQVEENEELRKRVGSLEEALATSNTAFGTMIIQDLGYRDGYTHRHAAATAVYAADLGREMKLGEAHVGRLRMAGLLHNIGLFGMPEDLLLATGRLNSIALSRLAEHAARGENALAAVPEFEEMASWVRWHHERPDGRGYPDKLRGSWIPLEAKILAVAQAYAAMVLDQPRRPGMAPAEAREKLSAGIGTEFDGIVVRAFLRILDTESEGYRMADDHRFAFPVLETRERTSERARLNVTGSGIEEIPGRSLPQ
jgi:HD-GYP domain-containing protein (c-di-GMP phosphodiesterase class II)